VSNELQSIETGAITKFKPEKSKEIQSVLQAAIYHAETMKKWEELWVAVDLLIKEQTEFVAWWDANVGVRQSPGANKSNAALRSIISAAKAEEATGIAQQQVSKWRKELKVVQRYRERLRKPSYKKGMADRTDERAELQTGEMEWYTPARYIEKARRVLGSIDLDPASCEAAQKTIGASRFYSVDDDGLNQRWQGQVWLNPPYAGKMVAAFAQKMIDSWTCGDVTGAIMLTNSYTETSWWHGLATASDAICLTRGRIKFESPHGEKCAPTNGQAFFYFGNDLRSFNQEFSDVGLLMLKLEVPHD
jgi:phage N-6-adenine-methyltransferase